MPPTVFLPGDPARAARMASFLRDVQELPTARGQRAYAGWFESTPGGASVHVGIHSAGMGIPSLLIYAHELTQIHGATTLIRVGTCGTAMRSVNLGDLIVATAADQPPSIGTLAAGLAAMADPTVVDALWKAAWSRTTDHARWRGVVASSDLFYELPGIPRSGVDSPDTLGVEMEAAGLFVAARAWGVRAGAILTVSDHLTRHQHWSAAARATDVDAMLLSALDAALLLAREEASIRRSEPTTIA